MKRNKRFNIFGWLAASALLLTTACTDSADFNEAAKAGEEGMVTLNLSIQNQGGVTRADAVTGEISDGSQVDELIFAIYESDSENGTYTINSTKFNSTKLKVTNGYQITDVGTNSGQMKIAFKPNTLTKPGNTAAITLKIPVEDGKYYKIACWAQNSKCTAYTTTDLKAVTVSYQGANNNDELRDAFCASKSFSSNSSSIEVILKRPFAQINVGTAGWDYEGVAVLKPSAVSYTESKITLTGVADQYNVLEGQASASMQDLKAEFAFNRIPAFIHVGQADWDAALEEGGVGEGADKKMLYEKNCFANEEFLIIDLDEKNGIGEYVAWPTYKAWSSAHPDHDQTSPLPDSPYRTETFKYLSMCYVLVPEASEKTVADDVTYCATLNKIEFETQGDGDEVDDKGVKKKVAYTAFTASNVPVQKNWRTNIVSFEMFTDRTGFKLWVVPDYCGDYNSFDSGESWEKDGNGVENGQFKDDNTKYGWDYYKK